MYTIVSINYKFIAKYVNFNKLMGNNQNCLINGFMSSSSKTELEQKEMIDYIASYKPGRKLIFRNLSYNEQNTLLKLVGDNNKPNNILSQSDISLIQQNKLNEAEKEEEKEEMKESEGMKMQWDENISSWDKN